ncbi:Uncharacterized protein TCM_019283 [Theobroma cacao]|uniref:Uncharacterized protein n=1 Tax=Theobroma cacao TaxID=3641 RepID=A0A061ENV6_THECC|nr:Uncharacterized protein TCM_019283 [Theobroma cacao]
MLISQRNWKRKETNFDGRPKRRVALHGEEREFEIWTVVHDSLLLELGWASGKELLLFHFLAIIKLLEYKQNGLRDCCH